MTTRNIGVKPGILEGCPKLAAGEDRNVLLGSIGAQRVGDHLSSIVGQNGHLDVGVGGDLIEDIDGLLALWLCEDTSLTEER